MAMTLQGIRDFVRTHLDLEVDDLPDDILDTFIRDGSKRIERAMVRWPFYEKTWIFATVSGSSDYPKSGIAADIDEISFMEIADNRSPLQWLSMDELQTLQRLRPTTSRPYYFAEWQDTFSLFPTPDIAYGVVLRGYRVPHDWVADGAGGTPDMPDELHNTVATFALSKSYAQQEDPELSSFYERQFNDELQTYMRRISVMPLSQPLVLNGGPRTRSGRSDVLRRPLYGYAGGVF